MRHASIQHQTMTHSVNKIQEPRRTLNKCKQNYSSTYARFIPQRTPNLSITRVKLINNPKYNFQIINLKIKSIIPCQFPGLYKPNTNPKTSTNRIKNTNNSAPRLKSNYLQLWRQESGRKARPDSHQSHFQNKAKIASNITPKRMLKTHPIASTKCIKNTNKIALRFKSNYL